MRILYVSPAYKPAYRIGGPVRTISAAAETLVARGHEVTVVTTTANLDEDLDVPIGRPVDVEGVEVWYFRRQEPLQKTLPFVSYLSRSMGYIYAPEMKQALRSMTPPFDLVHTQMPFVYTTFAGARAARQMDKPLFYHQRGNFDPTRLQFRSLKKRVYIALVEKPIMRRATTLIALTETERASFEALGLSTPIEVVPNGVTVPPENLDSAARVEQRHGIPRGAKVVLFLGRMHPIKGAEKLLEAFISVVDRLPDAYLVMAGPDEWRIEETYRSRVAEAGLSGRVVFPGMVVGDEKHDLLARADLFSLPSVAEGFSMAVLEALASSTAVMISPGCNFPEVGPAGAGVVVENSVEKLGAELERLLRDEQSLRRMGAAARKLVIDHYSWDVVTDRLVDVYERGIARHAASRPGRLRER
jgi:glycosyltransferase involved in cell wall biosynthesis